MPLTFIPSIAAATEWNHWDVVSDQPVKLHTSYLFISMLPNYRCLVFVGTILLFIVAQ